MKDDIELISKTVIQEKLYEINKDFKILLKNAKQGMLLNNNINLVICGQPNVGKSTLLNALTRENTAIVTGVAGTTTDVIKERILLGDMLINIFDTAGLRTTENIIEKEGVIRANKAINIANTILFVYDVKTDFNKLSQFIPKHNNIIFVANKIDAVDNYKKHRNHIYISADKKIGLDNLQKAIIKNVFIADKNDVILARARHIIYLEKAYKNLKSAIRQTKYLELLAEDLRQMQNNLNIITGKFSADDLLGNIFGNFCIGK